MLLNICIHIEFAMNYYHYLNQELHEIKLILVYRQGKTMPIS